MTTSLLLCVACDNSESKGSAATGDAGTGAGGDGGDPSAKTEASGGSGGASGGAAGRTEGTPGSGGEAAGGTGGASSDDGAVGGAGDGGTSNGGSGDGGISDGDGGSGDGGTTGGASSNDTGGASTGGQAGDISGTPTHEERQTLPDVRQEHAATALDGEVYVLGGFTPSVTASMQAYDPQLDSWRDVADFPETLHHPNMEAVGDHIYVLGFNRGSSFTNIDDRVFAYNAANDEWSERASLPAGTERASSCTAVLGNKIYLFAGAVDTSGDSTTVTDSSVYDTDLDEWEILPDLPEPREHCVAGAVDGMLYVVSGRDGGITGLESESWAFDPETKEFSDRAPIPTPRGGTAGAVVGGKIFVFGGEGNEDDSDGVFYTVEAYDPKSDTWESFPDMASGRHGFAAAAVGGRIYLPGGATSQGFGANDIHTVFFFE